MLEENTLFAHRYRLVKRLGQGAFSEVWKAEDTKAGSMVVALKIYAPDKGMDEDGVKMFSSEFTLVFNVSHKNLLTPSYYDDYNGSPYLVLPFCEQGSAQRRIGLMDEREMAKFLFDVSGALAFLHAQHPPIIHQDIKPENILNDNGVYMLSDFGVSTHVKPLLNHLTGMTGSLKEAGTLDYMAPERFSKDKVPIMSNDIWSLGATIYELLTMELPFVMGGLTQANGEKIPHLKGSYSPLLKQIIEDCMILETWKRPRAEQLYEVARSVLEGHPVPDPLPWKEPDDENDADTLPPPSPSANDGSETAGDVEDERKPADDDDKWPEPPQIVVPDTKISKTYIAVLAVAGAAIGVLLALI